MTCRAIVRVWEEALLGTLEGAVVAERPTYTLSLDAVLARTTLLVDRGDGSFPVVDADGDSVAGGTDLAWSGTQSRWLLLLRFYSCFLSQAANYLYQFIIIRAFRFITLPVQELLLH